MDEKDSIFKIIALLLQYPDRELFDDLPDLDEAISGVSDATTKEKCQKFITYVRETPLPDLQQDYTATFDLTPETCLNLSYHKFGDGRQRGPALLVFREAYKSMGYEPAATELPDYLPMVLEFLSLCPQQTRSALIADYSGVIEDLSNRLHEKASPYVDLFSVLSSLGKNRD